MKRLFYSFTVMFLSLNGYCQKTFVSVGAEVAIPNSLDLKMVAGTGFGGSVRVESFFTSHLSGIATVGYLLFAERSNTFNSSKFKAALVQAGVKFYAVTKEETPKGLFITGEMGLMPTSVHFKYVSNNPDFTFRESGFTITPGVGYQIGNIEPSFRLQFNLMAGGFNIYYLNFRLAYAFLNNKK
ncbi:MAG: hypothetical protein ABJA78_01875 [Ferruginibacter sp.]